MSKRQRCIDYVRRHNKIKYRVKTLYILKKNWLLRMCIPIAECKYLEEFSEISPMNLLKSFTDPILEFLKALVMFCATIVSVFVIIVFLMPFRIVENFILWRKLHKKVIRWEKTKQAKRRGGPCSMS